MLYLERKRAERSGNPFVLMLFDIDSLHKNKKKSAVKIISESLALSMREVDLKGWYKHDSVIGAIFTGAGASQINIIKNKYFEILKIQSFSDQSTFQNIMITFHIFPEKSNEGEDKSRFDMNLYPELYSKQSEKIVQNFIKRMVDIAGSMAGLMLFFPAFLLIPFIIKLTSEGPVLFRQKRVGKYGKTFTFLKFRTMVHNNDPKIHKDYIKKLIRDNQAYTAPGDRSEATYKIKDDSRITPLGKLLRKTSLDEIPQFLNVLTGEMSLVGPRPPIPYELENYDIWHLRRVLEVKPGITGLWQIEGRSRTTFNEMVRLDLQYIRKWSNWLDIKLIVRTPWCLFTTKGAL
jgi:lipopolysaccharide/colanic/teichoic acid biosynthesis glycosyltransferase